MQFPAVFIMGPTASGKTALAIELAERYNALLINVDSTQVYKRLHIGAAKPDAEELARGPHELLDIREPWEPYTVGDFCQDAAQLIQRAHAEGRMPVLVGGTMMYFRALQFGLSNLPSCAPETRLMFQKELEEIGLPALRERLRALDPETEARTEAGDTQRTLRALEVLHDTGRTLTDWQTDPPKPVLPLDVLPLVLWPEPRAELHARIATRFDRMIADGFVDEVKNLAALPEVEATLPAMRSVGYRQMLMHLDGECSLEEARELGVIATRQLAKRQYTWLRSWPEAHYLNPLDKESSLTEAAIDLLQAWSPRLTTPRSDA